MKRIYALSLLMTVLFAACSEESITPNEQEPLDEATVLAIEAAVKDTIEYKRLMQMVCTDVNEPAEGEVLYDATPGVRYIGVDSEEAAREHFLSLMLPTGYNEKNLANTTDGFTYTVLGASLSYTIGGDDGVLATVNLSLPECPEWKRLVFLSPSDWPANDYDSPTIPGDLWLHDGMYYLTTRACQHGQNGKMICFDFDEDKREYDKYPDVTWTVGFYMPKGCASYETWYGMYILLNDKRDLLWRIADTLSKLETGSNMIWNLSDMLNRKDVSYLVDGYEVKTYWYWFGDCYASTVTTYMPFYKEFWTITWCQGDRPGFNSYRRSTEFSFGKSFDPYADSSWELISLNVD